jgi:hypothetical protein
VSQENVEIVRKLFESGSKLEGSLLQGADLCSGAFFRCSDWREGRSSMPLATLIATKPSRRWGWRSRPCRGRTSGFVDRRRIQQ